MDSLSHSEPPIHTYRNPSEVDPVNDAVAPVTVASVNKWKVKMAENEVEALYLDREAPNKQQRGAAVAELATLQRQADEELA